MFLSCSILALIPYVTIHFTTTFPLRYRIPIHYPPPLRYYTTIFSLLFPLPSTLLYSAITFPPRYHTLYYHIFPTLTTTPQPSLHSHPLNLRHSPPPQLAYHPPHNSKLSLFFLSSFSWLGRFFWLLF